MANITQKIEAEQRMRELLEMNDLPAPDAVEYGYTCIRLFWRAQNLVLVIDIDPPPDRDDDDGTGHDDEMRDLNGEKASGQMILSLSDLSKDLETDPIDREARWEDPS